MTTIGTPAKSDPRYAAVRRVGTISLAFDLNIDHI